MEQGCILTCLGAVCQVDATWEDASKWGWLRRGGMRLERATFGDDEEVDWLCHSAGIAAKLSPR